jgi:hypothetical protein
MVVYDGKMVVLGCFGYINGVFGIKMVFFDVKMAFLGCFGYKNGGFGVFLV